MKTKQTIIVLIASAAINFAFLSCRKEEAFINTPPTIDNQEFSIKDDCVNGTIVDTVIASDIDKKQTLTYSILSGNLNNAFIIDPNSGIIRVNNSTAIKFENTPVFELAITVTDSYIDEMSASAKVTINIVDAFKNGRPVIINQSFNIDENKPNGTAVGTVIATDFDFNQNLKFHIISGNTNNAFKIDSLSGIIKVNNSSVLDYEKTRAFDLTVEVSDDYKDPLSASAKISININDVFENRPPEINNQNFSIDENKPNGTFVGTVLALDYDPNQLLTYSITSGNTNNAFAIESNSGNLYVNNIYALNYEQIQSFELKVKVVDNYLISLSDTAIITVKIRDVEEFPIPQNGLVAYYPFNGNANDESGNNHNGTVYGASLTTDRHHKANSAYEFDGVNDYINTFSTFDYQYRTISVWVYAYDIHGISPYNHAILAQDSPTLINGNLAASYEDGILKINAGGSSPAGIFQSNQNIENRWYHLVIIRDGVSTRYYINGDLKFTGNSGVLTSTLGLNQLLIGVGRSTNMQYFSGKIDDIAIYNRALSQTEINALYNCK